MTATYSDIYLRPSALQDDSARMRVQLEALYAATVPAEDRFKALQYIRQHSGITPSSSGSYHRLDLHFQRGSIPDVLDSITAVADWLASLGRNQRRHMFLTEVQRIFDQQHVKFAVDDRGTVRLRIDTSFELEREASLSGLGLPRYVGVRTEFEAAYEALSASKPDGKRAVRGIFEACEVIFKLMFAGTRRIGAPEIGSNLMPFIEEHYAADLPSREAAKKLVQAFSDWVAAAQFYRHGQGQEEPNQPPLEIAVAILAEGAAYLRWLVHLDQVKLET